MATKGSREEFLDEVRGELLKIPAVRGYDITLVNEGKTIGLFIEPRKVRDVADQFTKINSDSYP